VDLLLDTHALLWWLEGGQKLRPQAFDAIGDPDNNVFLSAVSAFEIAIKVRAGKLPVEPNVGRWLPEEAATNRFRLLPVTVEHAARVEHLPRLHGDPFDQLLVAQALVEQLTLVTADQRLEQYGARILRC